MLTLTRSRRGLAALTATLFLAVWASMAIAPCLMAAEAIVGGDCPHCPEPPPPCHDPGGAGVCTYVDGYDFDGRTAAMPRVDVELVALPAGELAIVSPPPVRRASASCANHVPPDPGGPRLHLRNCVLTN